MSGGGARLGERGWGADAHAAEAALCVVRGVDQRPRLGLGDAHGDCASVVETTATTDLASARPWTSSVSSVPLIDRIVSPFITRPEAAQPSATSVTCTWYAVELGTTGNATVVSRPVNDSYVVGRSPQLTPTVFAHPNAMRGLAFMMATLLFGRAGAESLTVAMAHIKEDAGFDPKEPPEHKTDIKVGLYLEHLLDVRAPPHDPFSAHPQSLAHLPALRSPSALSTPFRTLRTQVSIEEHTFDMDFYLTEEWKDGRNYRRDVPHSLAGLTTTHP
jgi:hypothetical protein